MTKAFHAVQRHGAGAQDVTTASAAYLVAVKRVADAVATRGWVK